MSLNLLNDADLDQFFDADILNIIGANDLPADKKQAMYQEMALTVQNRVIARIYTSISEEEGAELDNLIDQEDTIKVQAYLREKDLDMPAMLTQEALAFKLELYELFKQTAKLDPNKQPNNIEV